MDLTYLLNILLKRKWLILSVILVSSIATWFLIGKLPNTYKADSILETGITTYKGPTLQKDNTFIQQFQIEGKFSNLMQRMRSRTVVRSLTKSLLEHDLIQQPDKPFRVLAEDKLEVTQHELDDMVQKLKMNFEDTMEQEITAQLKYDNKLAEAYEYDHESLMKKMEIARIPDTDYLKIEFKSENPELSYFVVNTFLDKFSSYYDYEMTKDERKVLLFNEEELRQVKAELDSVVLAMNTYKTKNGLLDVTKQRESIISQKKEVEFKLEEVEQSIPSLQNNLVYLDKQIYEYNKRTSNDAYAQLKSNGKFAAIDQEIARIQGLIIDAKAAGSKSTGALERKLARLKQDRDDALENSISTIPSSEREVIDERYKDLIKRQLDIKLDLELARQAVKSYKSEILRLSIRADKLLEDDQNLYYMVEEKNRLDKEYEKIRNALKESDYLADGTENPLRVIEPAEMPTEPESKNRVVFSAFAGVAGGTLTSIFLFLLAFVDTSVQSPSQFNKATGLPLVGHVNKVNFKNTNLKDLFGGRQAKKDLEYFKESIRKLRSSVESSGAKTFLFVSPKAQEGKSFLLLLLSYALSLNNKKVLIVDTNFKNNTLSGYKAAPSFEVTTKNGAQPVKTGKNLPKDPNLSNIDIVGNKGGSQSPSEVLGKKNFAHVIEAYKRKYDFVFMEAAAMNDFSDARELLPYAEKLAVIISADSPLGNTDKDTLDFLKSIDGKLFGGILNNVDLKNI